LRPESGDAARRSALIALLIHRGGDNYLQLRCAESKGCAIPLPTLAIAV
jgi:hypothetical protein